MPIIAYMANFIIPKAVVATFVIVSSSALSIGVYNPPFSISSINPVPPVKVSHISEQAPNM